MTKKCYDFDGETCFEMVDGDGKKGCHTCWNTEEICCPNHSSKSSCTKVSKQCSCKCTDDEGDGAPCRNLSACSTTCQNWASANCSSSNNDNDRKNVTGQSTTDGSGISAGAGIAIGIVSIFALVGFIALIIGGSGNKRRRTRGNR